MQQKPFKEMLSDIDADATARLFLRKTCTMDYYLGLLNEVAKIYGYSLENGDRVMIHPNNVPENLRLNVHPIIMITPLVSEDSLEFFPTGNLKETITNLRPK